MRIIVFLRLSQQASSTASNAFAGYFPSKPTLARSKDEDAKEGGEASTMDEDAMIEAMMNANSAAWTHNQQSIGSEGYRPRAFRPHTRPPTAPAMPALPPPPNYVCFRCGQKGHYITNCPTNTDPTFDKPRLKKTTGIPRSFLKVVNPEEQSGGMLVTADGSVVVAVSNDQEWQKIAISKASQAVNTAPEEIPLDLKCKICSTLLNDPTCCPNCSVAYCEECILKGGGKNISCPECHAMFNAEQLVPSEALQKRISQFVAEHQKPSLKPTSTIIPPTPLFPFPLPPFPFLPLPPFLRPPAQEKPEPSKPRSKSPKRNRSRSPSRNRDRHRYRERDRSRSRSPKRTYHR